MANCHRIIITLFVSTALSAQPACGETNSFTNNIDFSAFYREWKISPSNAVEQITPALMELAATSKTNAVDQTVLHKSLLHLFSTNTLSSGNEYLSNIKQKLLVNTFKASGTYSTPQEEQIMSLAKTLAFFRDVSSLSALFPIEHTNQSAYNAMVQRLIENGASKKTWPVIFNGYVLPKNSKLPTLISPSGLDPEEAWILYKRFLSLQFELRNAESMAFYTLTNSLWIARELSQEERDMILVKIVSLQMLDPYEERRIAEDLNVEPKALQAQPTPTE